MTTRANKAVTPTPSSDPKSAGSADKVKSRERLLAAAAIGPTVRHAQLEQTLGQSLFGKTGKEGVPDLEDYMMELKERLAAGAAGDKSAASHLLLAQALSLDAIFTEMARRMALNMGEYLGATETYARIALKAQAGSRATIEALAKLHQPREQTVRHVHVNEGGQAVIADEFHHHTGGQKIGSSSEQPHAKGTPGPALSGPDPLGEAVPIPGDQGQGAMPDARGQRQRRTMRQP